MQSVRRRRRRRRKKKKKKKRMMCELRQQVESRLAKEVKTDKRLVFVCAFAIVLGVDMKRLNLREFLDPQHLFHGQMMF